MDGLLILDKPAGLTSHDVVAAIRRILRERRVGHTGTLDPAATGVLPIVVGRATRLARFISGRDKTYAAAIALGTATDTGDAAGVPVGEAYQGPWPSREAIDSALDAFRGTFLQHPPAYSAKKIGGRRSYEVARELALRHAQDERKATSLVVSPSNHERHNLPTPVSVTVIRVEILDVNGPNVTLTMDCSAGFYVRALARDLGERLGTGAHLTALRRTRSGDHSLADTVALDEAARDPDVAARRMIPLAQMLPSMPAVTLSDEGVRLASHGCEIGPHLVSDGRIPIAADSQAPGPQSLSQTAVRLVSPTGDLVGIGEPTNSGSLHPSVVLV